MTIGLLKDGWVGVYRGNVDRDQHQDHAGDFHLDMAIQAALQQRSVPNHDSSHAASLVMLAGWAAHAALCTWRRKQAAFQDERELRPKEHADFDAMETVSKVTVSTLQRAIRVFIEKTHHILPQLALCCWFLGLQDCLQRRSPLPNVK